MKNTGDMIPKTRSQIYCLNKSIHNMSTATVF